MLQFFNRKHKHRPLARALPLPTLSASSLVGWQAAQNEPSSAGEANVLLSGSEMALEQLVCTASGNGGAAASAATVALSFPCVLRPAVRPAGIDLHLQLFQLRVGEPWPLAGASCRRAGDTAVLMQQQAQAQQPPLLAVADKTLCLLAARLIFPDSVAPALRTLAAAHCATAAMRALGLLLTPSARAAARHRLQRWCARAPLAELAARGAAQLGGLAQRYGEPAALLLAVAALWAYLHPSSAQVGECIAGAQHPRAACRPSAVRCMRGCDVAECMPPCRACLGLQPCKAHALAPALALAAAALVPVLAGYNQTAKHCARMGLSGDAAEEVRHRFCRRRRVRGVAWRAPLCASLSSSSAVPGPPSSMHVSALNTTFPRRGTAARSCGASGTSGRPAARPPCCQTCQRG